MVNEAGRLLGVITVDDVVHVIEEEAEEDILRLGGLAEPDIFASPLQTGMRRFPWLLINLGTAILASVVIAQFEEAIAQVVALAVLMPIVASMGGNGGTQTVTVVVRALATREITAANALARAAQGARRRRPQRPAVPASPACWSPCSGSATRCSACCSASRC